MYQFVDVTLITSAHKTHLRTIRIFLSDSGASIKTIARSAIRKTVFADVDARGSAAAGAAFQSAGVLRKREMEHLHDDAAVATISCQTSAAGAAAASSSPRRASSSPAPRHPPRDHPEPTSRCAIVKVSIIPEVVAAQCAGSIRSDRGSRLAGAAFQVLVDDAFRDVASPGEELLVEVEGWAVDAMIASTAPDAAHASPDQVAEVMRDMKRRRLEFLLQAKLH
jgi:hypothetical protein